MTVVILLKIGLKVEGRKKKKSCDDIDIKKKSC